MKVWGSRIITAGEREREINGNKRNDRIEKEKVRFILRKEDVEIIMPEEMEAKKFKTEHEGKITITDAESIIFKLVELKDPKDPLIILTTVFKHQSFRSNQKEIIENVLSRKNTLAILPTGAGKSLCFQIPALIFDGLTVVVSPLIALMKDQVDNLKKKSVFEVLKSCTISLIAIDEVHCISIWGHDFRPDYLRLRQVIKKLGNPPPPLKKMR